MLFNGKKYYKCVLIIYVKCFIKWNEQENIQNYVIYQKFKVIEML